MITQEDLAEGVGALGTFIGLLTQSDSKSFTVNTGWFSDPLVSLKTCGNRTQSLVEIIDSILGPAIDPSPTVFTNARWYSLPNPATDTSTVFHLVVADPSKPGGQIGLGVLHTFGGDVAATTYIYLPLFSYDPNGGIDFIATSDNHPCQVGVDVTAANKITVKNVTFSGLTIDVTIALSGTTPTFSLLFKNLAGTSKKAQYNSLADLQDDDVILWLAETVVQTGAWLNSYVGNITYTIGDLLEAAGYLSRNYLLVPGNFPNPKDLVATISNSIPVTSDDQYDGAVSQTVANLSKEIWNNFSAANQTTLKDPATTDETLQTILVAELQKLVKGSPLYNQATNTPPDFASLPLSPETTNLLARNVTDDQLVQLNRLLLQDIYKSQIVANPYAISIKNIQGDAKTIALNFVLSVLDALSFFETPLIYLPFGGISIIKNTNKSDGSSDYGLIINTALDILKDPAPGKSTPEVTLSLGTWFTGEDDSNNWTQRCTQDNSARPGLSFFFLHRDKSGNLSFSPKFSLTSVGINIRGANKTPLFNIGGYTVKGFELRGSLNPSDWSFGVGCRVDNLGMPLAPGFNAVSGNSTSNPVAQNLIGSSSGAGSGDADPVNPSFSFSVAYVEHAQFSFQLYNSNDQPSSVVLIPINKALGPLYCSNLGIGWMPDVHDLSLLFDGSVSIGGLDISLTGLTIGIPVTSPGDFSKYDLDLDGLGITFSQGGIDLSGAFVKIPPDLTVVPPRNYPQYDGEVLIKGGSFTIAGIGSYAYLPASNSQSGYTSLFVFGLYIGELGGPSFFFVTGLAAGFGYNRAIVLPDQNSVTNFPLVAALNDPTIIGAQQQPDGSWRAPDLATVMRALDADIPPQRGEYWFAAGVRFTSFDLIHSSALLTVEFGNELEISILGISWISLPPPPSPTASVPDHKFAFAELGIEVKLLPDDGFFAATAILTPNSFVLDPDCKLTGGYAFYVWFGKNAHAGEFVMTLGGYHPSFTPPSYYPTVPRLGFTWNVSGDVTISGDAYFALTSSAIMAGGGLQVMFSSGNLHAWFIARMDALIVWAPFHYEIYIGVSIGVSYRLHLLFITVTLKIELGATLTIWGPKMGGTVYINWYIISFSIPFGADRTSSLPPLAWTDDNGTGFAQSLLPNKKSTKQPSPVTSFAAGATSPHDDKDPAIYSITVNDGLLTVITDNDGDSVWIARPNKFTFSVVTAIPATAVNITPSSGQQQTTILPQTAGYFVCIRPMKATLSGSIVTITLSLMNDNGDYEPYDLAGEFDYSSSLVRVPAAKWGQPLAKDKDTGKDEDPEQNTLLDGRLMGLEGIAPKPTVLTPIGVNALNIDVTTAFTYDVVDQQGGDYNPYHLHLEPGLTPSDQPPQVDDDAFNTIHNSMMDAAAVAVRAEIFLTLRQLGIDPMTNEPMTSFAANPAAVLTGDPFVLETT